MDAGEFGVGLHVERGRVQLDPAGAGKVLLRKHDIAQRRDADVLVQRTGIHAIDHPHHVANGQRGHGFVAQMVNSLVPADAVACNGRADGHRTRAEQAARGGHGDAVDGGLDARLVPGGDEDITEGAEGREFAVQRVGADLATDDVVGHGTGTGQTAADGADAHRHGRRNGQRVDIGLLDCLDRQVAAARRHVGIDDGSRDVVVDRVGGNGHANRHRQATQAEGGGKRCRRRVGVNARLIRGLDVDGGGRDHGVDSIHAVDERADLGGDAVFACRSGTAQADGEQAARQRDGNRDDLGVDLQVGRGFDIQRLVRVDGGVFGIGLDDQRAALDVDQLPQVGVGIVGLQRTHR